MSNPMIRIRLFAATALWSAASLSLTAETPTHSPRSAPGPRIAMQAHSGTLRNYRAGKSVAFAGPDGRVRVLPVDPAARVDRNLARGQQVNVISMTDEAGKERVSAISRSSPTDEAPKSASVSIPPKPR